MNAAGEGHRKGPKLGVECIPCSRKGQLEDKLEPSCVHVAFCAGIEIATAFLRHQWKVWKFSISALLTWGEEMRCFLGKADQTDWAQNNCPLGDFLWLHLVGKKSWGILMKQEDLYNIKENAH